VHTRSTKCFQHVPWERALRYTCTRSRGIVIGCQERVWWVPSERSESLCGSRTDGWSLPSVMSD
jgi:hypothetical protein